MENCASVSLSPKSHQAQVGGIRHGDRQEDLRLAPCSVRTAGSHPHRYRISLWFSGRSRDGAEVVGALGVGVYEWKCGYDVTVSSREGALDTLWNQTSWEENRASMECVHTNPASQCLEWVTGRPFLFLVVGWTQGRTYLQLLV